MKLRAGGAGGAPAQAAAAAPAVPKPQQQQESRPAPASMPEVPQVPTRAAASIPVNQVPVTPFKAPQNVVTYSEPMDINKISGTRNETRVKMSKMRQTVASRLKNAQNTTAMLTTFNEINMGYEIHF